MTNIGKLFGWGICALLCGVFLLSGHAAASTGATGAVREATPVDQRIVNFERLLHSVSGERVAASGDAGARRLLSQSRDAHARAKAALAAGDTDAAKASMNEALAKFMEASRRLPDEDPADAQVLEARYRTLRQGLEVFQQAHQRNFDRVQTAEGAGSGVEFDAAAVARLVAEAEQKAQHADYAAANALLTMAQQQVTGAIRGMMQHRTLVHEVVINTPRHEYEYELRRFQAYVELVPVAIEMRVPPEATVTSMRASVDKAQWMLEQAGDKAHAGDYPVAIRMVLDATDEVRKALRDAGVEM